MKLPDNHTLPFYSYGIFQPGESGYPNIHKFVENIEYDSIIRARLLIRDGFPIVEPDNDRTTKGVTIHFQSDFSKDAYSNICAMEPGKQYRWDNIKVIAGSDEFVANVLIGKSPKKGSVPAESSHWHGRNDPFFVEAISVIEKELQENKFFDFDFNKYFRLQMAYMLLWVVIERFVSMRFYLGGGQDDDGIMKKIMRLADDKIYIKGLKQFTSEKRDIFRSDDPTKHVKWDSDMPAKSIDYYYQIRSNITHRGKAAMKDFNLLSTCLEELLTIMKAVIKETFDINKTSKK